MFAISLGYGTLPRKKEKKYLILIEVLNLLPLKHSLPRTVTTVRLLPHTVTTVRLAANRKTVQMFCDTYIL